MSTDPERLAWNKDGELAAERLRARGIHKFSREEYAQEFTAVRREREERKQTAVEKHGYSSKPGSWRIYRNGDGDIEVEVEGARALTKLSNIVCGLPKLADHSIDINLAVQVINASFADLASLAAGDFLFDQSRKNIHKQNKPATSDFTAAMERARAEYPSIVALYNGARVSADTLRTLLWPLFKTTEEYTQRKAEVRKYGEHAHIYQDGCGREFRRY